MTNKKIARDTQELRQILLEVIEDVRAKKTDYKDASAIGRLAGVVVSSAKLDVIYARMKTPSGAKTKLVALT